MRTFASIIGLSLASWIAWSYWPTGGESVDQGIMSDVGGPLRLVVCSATSARKSSLRNANLVTSIVNELPVNTHVLLLVNDHSAFQVSEGKRNVTVVKLAPDSDITIWPQDPFVVVNGSDGTTRLLVSSHFSRLDDRIMANALAKTLELNVRELDLVFEGGNIVSDQDHVLIGYDTIRHNRDELKVSFQEVVRRFAFEFQKPVHVIGKSRQPVGHIDMLITPLGEQTFAVADSRAGAALVSRLMNESPTTIQRFERQCERDFFGRPGVDRLVDEGGTPILGPQVVGKTKNVIAFSRLIAGQLDQVATQLESKGFRVVRVPALIPEHGSSWQKSSANQAGYPILSYNNVLIQQQGDVRTVFLPQYGLARLDSHAIATWEQLGFFVVPINGFSTSAMYGGGLRCCTKVLLRDPS